MISFKNLILKNLFYFITYYRLIAVAVAITVTVITGSLTIGDSVRSTLVKRVGERLGNTETVIFSQNSFIESSILEEPLFNKANGVLLSNGFVSVSGELIPVTVWGTADGSIPVGSAMINSALAKELAALGHEQASASPVGDLVLRLPATGLAPSGSLFVTDNYTASIRLAFAGIVEAEDGGNLSLRNEQIIPFNIFLNRRELAATLEIDNKINLILHEKRVSQADFNNAWDYTLSGIRARVNEGFTEIASDRIFIQEKAIRAICDNNPNPDRMFSYLVNSIDFGRESIPYSFVTAMDSYRGQTLQSGDIIISDYVSRRTGAGLNDTVRLSYYVSHDLKTLSTKTVDLIVSQIVPLSELHADSTLSADFPGLSDVERCTDWDSDLPINMDLITDEDERFWELYRTTPKIIIPFRAVVNDWGNPYGEATAIRVDSIKDRLSELSPEMFGIQIIYPREAGLNAAKGGVDFASLFISLGFFIIVAAILLMTVPLSEMLYKRRDEIRLLQALGYNKKRTVKLIWRESAPVVLAASALGVVTGLLYTCLVLFLLGNVWKGATHTSGFALFPNWVTVGAGLCAGIALSMITLRIAINRSLSNGKRTKRTGKGPKERQIKIQLLIIVILVAIVTINLLFNQSAAVFVFTGIALIVIAALCGNYILNIKGSTLDKDLFSSAKLVYATLYADRRQALLSFFTLAAGVFIVFSVGLNRRSFTNSSQLLAGTGGYSLWCENSVPVYHNINTSLGKEKLALTALSPEAEVVQILRYGADNASCLNLNKAIKPTVLGIDMGLLANSGFEIEQCLFKGDKSEIFGMMQTPYREPNIGTGNDHEPVYPALVDETVLTWSLMLKLGDTIGYETMNGRRITVKLVGTLKNSIFQGNILIDKRLFSEIWSEITGSELMLVKVADADIKETKSLLSQALNNYGVKISAAADRLKEFNSVTDTYLTIFMTLGGLGLLLGIMGFVIVVRKNFAARQQEIALYHALGFTDATVGKLLYRENIIVPVYAIITGTLASVTGVSAGFANVSLWLWFTALTFTIIFILCVLLFVKQAAKLPTSPQRGYKPAQANVEQ
jgi:putative ABC transport system permease protein